MGFFLFVSITIKNDSDDVINTPVCIELVNPPVGYEHRDWGCVKHMHVPPHSEVTEIFLKPLLGGDVSNCEGEGPPLKEQSQVVIVMGLSGDNRVRNQSVYYKAKYVNGTKFVDVSNTTFHIVNYQQNNKLLLREHSDGMELDF